MEESRHDYVEEGMLVSEIHGTYQALIKNAEGEAEIHTLSKHSTKRRPADNETSIEDLIVRKAAPNVIQPLRRTPRKRTRELQALVGGDAQFPFADEAATGLFLRAARELRPEDVILVGDMVDFPALSRFAQRKEWVGSTQKGIDEYYTFLTNVRANAPDATITVVHGNHEQRLINALERNLSEVAGIRQALGNRALLSVQHLARYDELDINYVDGYPNGTFWLEDNLKFIHGTNVKKGGSNAAKYLNEERETTIYGHTHRLEYAQRTFATRLGKTTLSAASPGALCLTDGSVPGFNYSPNAEGTIVKKAEDWQAGALVINHEGLHHDITPVQFTERGMLLKGQRYE